MSTFKKILLPLIILAGVWALWPQAEDPTKGTPNTATPTKDRAKVKYHLKISPGMYLPGSIPMNVGAPLEQMDFVAQRFEKLYPDTEIEFVGVPGVREWLVTQLTAGTAPDILSVNSQEIWPDVHKGWYIPLDASLNAPNPFVKMGEPGSSCWWDLFKYPDIMKGTAAPDGKMYSVGFNVVQIGVFYNKDLFDQLSLKPPLNWEEYLELQKKIQEAGYIPTLISLNAFTEWGIDLMFDQLYDEIMPGIDVYKDPVREVYLKGYLDWPEIAFLHQKGYFSRNDPRWIEMWHQLKRWRQFLDPDIARVDSFKLFATRKAAMVIGGSWIVNQLSRDPNLNFQYDIFHLPPLTRESSRYANGHMMCKVGGCGTQFTITNSSIKDTGDMATSERLKRCISFLQFLTIPENSGPVINEVVSFLPNIKGVEPHKALKPFEELMTRHYASTRWGMTFDLRFNEILTRMFGLYLDDGISEKEFLDWMDKNLDAGIANIIRRKKFDLTRFEEKWKELAPLRENQKDLPHGIK